MALNSVRVFGAFSTKLRCVMAPSSGVGLRAFSISSPNRNSGKGPRVAVVLSGCGVYDGAEIHESSAVLVHLTRAGATAALYAPDIEQMHVIIHSQGSVSENEKRNVLAESARIARGQVEPLSALSAAEADAVVFPGGFGVAKNLSDFGIRGKDCKVIPEVERVIKDFHVNKKPMAFCCIAPVLAARVIPNATVTLGRPDDGSGEWPYSGAIDAVKAWEAQHQAEDVHGVCIDAANRIVTSPAFMYDTRQFHLIYDGIGNMVRELLKLL